jgi:hypothetical protein
MSSQPERDSSTDNGEAHRESKLLPDSPDMRKLRRLQPATNQQTSTASGQSRGNSRGTDSANVSIINMYHSDDSGDRSRTKEAKNASTTESRGSVDYWNHLNDQPNKQPYDWGHDGDSQIATANLEAHLQNQTGPSIPEIVCANW